MNNDAAKAILDELSLALRKLAGVDAGELEQIFAAPSNDTDAQREHQCPKCGYKWSDAKPV